MLTAVKIIAKPLQPIILVIMQMQDMALQQELKRRIPISYPKY